MLLVGIDVDHFTSTIVVNPELECCEQHLCGLSAYEAER